MSEYPPLEWVSNTPVTTCKVGDINYGKWELHLHASHFVFDTYEGLIGKMTSVVSALETINTKPVIRLFQVPEFIDNYWLASGYIFGVGEDNAFWRVDADIMQVIQVRASKQRF